MEIEGLEKSRVDIPRDKIISKLSDELGIDPNDVILDISKKGGTFSFVIAKSS